MLSHTAVNQSTRLHVHVLWLLDHTSSNGIIESSLSLRATGAETMKITDLKCTVFGPNPVVRIVTDAGIDG